MWKSAIAMVKEKPLFGWGIQGATEKRKQETKEKVATGNIGQFTHAHNQYLDDLSKRGIVGLLALLCCFIYSSTCLYEKAKHHER